MKEIHPIILLFIQVLDKLYNAAFPASDLYKSEKQQCDIIYTV